VAPRVDGIGLSGDDRINRGPETALALFAGERDRVISDLMGHVRTDLTKEVYTKVLPIMRETASDSLERLLSGGLRATFTQSVTEQVM
jgi:hypothetical protein